MDAGQIVRILIVVILVLVPILSQVMAKVREANKPPRPPAGGPRPAPRPPQEDFKQEIEDFLRRAAEGPQSKPPAQGRPAPRRKPAAPPSVPRAAKPPESAAPAPGGGSVVEHVRTYLDSSEFGRRTSQLGEEVAQADDKVDARVHQVFEHQLSQFDWRTAAEIEAAGGPPAPTGVSAGGIALLLANPENIRQAIVLNEILQRPEQRWA